MNDIWVVLATFLVGVLIIGILSGIIWGLTAYWLNKRAP